MLEVPTVPSPSVTPQPPAEAVAPLMRGLDVLRSLTAAESGDGTLALADLARTTGLARSTVDRICATLAHLGFVRLDGRDASLAPPLMTVANACLDALRVPGVLGPLADELADELDESVSLAVPDGDGIRFVHQVLRRRALSISFRVGDALPGGGCAPGLVFRDGLSLAVDDQLVERGLVAVAVPVRGPDGSVVCAVSVVSHTSRHAAGELAGAVRGPLETCVRKMEAELNQAPLLDESQRGSGQSPATEDEAPATIQSLARGLRVLTAFDGAHPTLTLTEIAEATGLARATARRALITYEHLGYVTHEDRAFRLTPRVLTLGCAPLSRTTLPRIAAPHLAALSKRLGESVGLSVPDGNRVRCTARVTPRRVMSVDIGVGSRLPAKDTAAGLLLRGDGESAVADGPEAGLRSVAVPVRDRAGRVVSALDVTAHQGRGDDDAWTEALRDTAALIAADLHVTSRFVSVPVH
ncbi:helix-turn-helix domain-containing protein [Streptomyces sp. NBC_01016]|uniref:IclR family transcriptional regulator domain-containing protein n=1 Tax=Streptomyces sp. NBC_01016 TaxID=2903720 RepID=UPI002252C0E6|nr:helix-turn-helix domain-containing protein [Streptomyces sp. NBC_01016]MCX4828016.1 helix-turn-helix domain-containing protein [Streptomyces sp. NBC_01016]